MHLSNSLRSPFSFLLDLILNTTVLSKIDVAAVLIRVAEWPPVWERAVHSAYCACISWAFVKFCVCPSFPFGIEGSRWVVIVLIPDHCLFYLPFHLVNSLYCEV